MLPIRITLEKVNDDNHIYKLGKQQIKDNIFVTDQKREHLINNFNYGYI
jgi:hypothetical protein